MSYILSGASVYKDNRFIISDILVSNGVISDIAPAIPHSDGIGIYKFNNSFIFPGLIDVHVHLREPGFLYKETIKSGTAAACRGGFCDVCAMPNLSPIPDSLENLAAEQEAIERDALVRVHPIAAITCGEKGEKLSDIDALADSVVAFSDDGRGVQSEEMMRNAMKKCCENKKIIAAHCEDNSLLHGGVVHDGEYAKKHGLAGISSESEWKQIERDILIAKETGCAYHVCHISTAQSVALIRAAKRDGVNITCETAPHYIAFDDSCLKDCGSFKMNPPIRAERDREALLEGICDGTIDMIATDHAPHSAEEKSRGISGSLNGIVGLETSFAACYTYLVKTGLITLEKLIGLMHDNSAERFKIGGKLDIGESADFTVFNLSNKFTVDSNRFATMGRSTPFEGMELFGSCVMTAMDGKILYTEDKSV